MLDRRTIVRRFAAALLAFAAVAGANQARADALGDIMAAGVLKVAVPQDFPPFGSVGADMTPVGYDIDVANLIAEKLGVSLELVPVTSANRIPYLQTKKVDLAGLQVGNAVGAGHGNQFDGDAKVFGDGLGHINVIADRGHVRANAAEWREILRHGNADGAAGLDVGQGIGLGGRGQPECKTNCSDENERTTAH